MSKKATKIGIAILAVALLVFAYLFSQKDFFGWRLNLSLSKIEASDYKSIAPSISFKYPKIFEIDSDPEHKYGKDYVVGLKLKTDNRTGCDVRVGGPEIDLSKKTEDIVSEIVDPIKEKTKDFSLFENKKTKIGGSDGVRISFSFLDPIGARVRLDQIFVKNGGSNLIIICGTGEYQYDFFKKDFQFFYDSIDFETEL